MEAEANGGRIEHGHDVDSLIDWISQLCGFPACDAHSSGADCPGPRSLTDSENGCNFRLVKAALVSVAFRHKADTNNRYNLAQTALSKPVSETIHRSGSRTISTRTLTAAAMPHLPMIC